MVANLINKVRDAKIRNAPNTGAAPKIDPNIYSDDEEETRNLPPTPSKVKLPPHLSLNYFKDGVWRAFKVIVYVICLPFLLCCDLSHTGFTYATSSLSEFRLSKKWRSFKDLWCGHVQNKIPVNQSAKTNKTLQFALILLILCLLLFLLTYYGNFGAISNLTREIQLNVYLKMSSGITTIWSWWAALFQGTAGLVASGYYSLTTLLSSNNNIQIQHSKRIIPSND